MLLFFFLQNSTIPQRILKSINIFASFKDFLWWKPESHVRQEWSQWTLMACIKKKHTEKYRRLSSRTLTQFFSTVIIYFIIATNAFYNSTYSEKIHFSNNIGCGGLLPEWNRRKCRFKIEHLKWKKLQIRLRTALEILFYQKNQIILWIWFFEWVDLEVIIISCTSIEEESQHRFE